MGLAVASGCEVEQPVYITDQLEMEELMRHNIELNGLKTRVKSAILNWYVPPPEFFFVTLNLCVPTGLWLKVQWMSRKRGEGTQKRTF